MISAGSIAVIQWAQRDINKMISLVTISISAVSAEIMISAGQPRYKIYTFISAGSAEIMISAGQPRYKIYNFISAWSADIQNLHFHLGWVGRDTKSTFISARSAEIQSLVSSRLGRPRSQIRSTSISAEPAEMGPM